jgi:hypothetical protein
MSVVTKRGHWPALITPAFVKTVFVKPGFVNPALVNIDSRIGGSW